ncbi:MAG: hypothetical protein ACRYFU_15750 [Janthinobacterium lividum]
MITVLMLIGPIPLLIFYANIRARIKRRKQPATDTQLPAPNAKPYESEAHSQPNIFMSRFPLTTQLYLRQQWTVARFGFIASFWIFTNVLCGSLIPPFADKLPTHDQRVWLSFVTWASVWSSVLPAAIAILAGIIAANGIIGSGATYNRTRPISMRVIYWGRVLPAFAALFLAATISIGIAFTAMRIAYGPVWNSLSASTTTTGTRTQVVIHMDIPAHSQDHPFLSAGQLSIRDGSPQMAVIQRCLWLSQNPAPRIFASSITTMALVFSTFILIFCQPFGAHKNIARGLMLGIAPFGSITVVFLFNVAKGHSAATSSFRHLSQLLFYSPPFQAPPPWRFLPIPIVLSIALLFLSERFYLRRDI